MGNDFALMGGVPVCAPSARPRAPQQRYAPAPQRAAQSFHERAKEAMRLIDMEDLLNRAERHKNLWRELQREGRPVPIELQRACTRDIAVFDEMVANPALQLREARAKVLQRYPWRHEKLR